MSNQIKQEFSPQLAKENVENLPNNKEDFHNKRADYPKWMRMVTCRRFPYFPQLGDLVVYFQQGHEAYLGELKKTGIPVSPRFKMNPNLNAEEVCFVDAVDFEIIGDSAVGKIHVARLQLSRTQNGKRTGQSFQICYHDMPNVLDFIVLKQHYDESMAMQLKPGDRIELIFDDKFYTGRVINRNPYQPEKYPNSAWRSVHLQWDTTARDKRSPWDLQKCARGRKFKMPANLEDQAKLGKHISTLEEWPVPEGRAESAESASQLYQDRLLDAITQLIQLEGIEPFREAIDLHLNKNKNYMDCVNYPIDLRTIEERILNGFYRRSISILHDIQFLAKNASSAFNDPIAGAHMIRSACLLVETLFQFMEDWEEKDAIDLYNRIDLSDSPLDCWRMKIDSAESAANSMALPESEQSISCRTRKNIGDKELGKDIATKAVPLWAMECREMVEQLNRTFITRRAKNNRDTSELASAFLENFRAMSEKLFDQCETPNKFLEELRQFISDQKHNVVERESRRSKVYHAILAMESQLESKQQSILANYRRKMYLELEELFAEDDEDEAQPNRQRKRASALSPQANRRNAEPESSTSTATQNTEMAPPAKDSDNKLKRKLDGTEQPKLHAPPKRKLEEPKVRQGTTSIFTKALEMVRIPRKESVNEPAESSAATATKSSPETVRKAELDELRACKRRLEVMEPEFQAHKRRLDEAELKMRNDAKKLRHYETLKPFVDAGMQFRLEKAKDGNIALALPNFAELSAHGKGFKVQSDPIDLAGFRWELCASRPANDAWMGILLKPNCPENYKGRFQLEVDCFFRISNKRSFANEIRKEMGTIVSNERGSVAIQKFAKIEDLRDPNKWFLQADGSVQLKVEFTVKSAQLDPCYEEAGDGDVQNGDGEED